MGNPPGSARASKRPSTVDHTLEELFTLGSVQAGIKLSLSPRSELPFSGSPHVGGGALNVGLGQGGLIGGGGLTGRLGQSYASGPTIHQKRWEGRTVSPMVGVTASLESEHIADAPPPLRWGLPTHPLSGRADRARRLFARPASALARAGREDDLSIAAVPDSTHVAGLPAYYGKLARRKA